MTDAQHTDRADDAGLSAEELERYHQYPERLACDTATTRRIIRQAATRTSALTTPAGGAGGDLGAVFLTDDDVAVLRAIVADERNRAADLRGTTGAAYQKQLAGLWSRLRSPSASPSTAPTLPAVGAGAEVREALETVLARDAEWGLSGMSNDCGCIRLSRRAEREYEAGKCPHQVARAALAQPAAPATGAREALKKIAQKAVNAFDALVYESEGVYGLHMNGDPAPWSDLIAGGRFESWTAEIENLRAALAAGGAGESPTGADRGEGGE